MVLGKDSPCKKKKKKKKIGEDSPIPKRVYLKIRRRDDVESLTFLEEGEFKMPIDGCIIFYLFLQLHFI